jgi:hypothetical protein
MGQARCLRRLSFLLLMTAMKDTGGSTSTLASLRLQLPHSSCPGASEGSNLLQLTVRYWRAAEHEAVRGCAAEILARAGSGQDTQALRAGQCCASSLMMHGFSMQHQVTPRLSIMPGVPHAERFPSPLTCNCAFPPP